MKINQRNFFNFFFFLTNQAKQLTKYIIFKILMEHLSCCCRNTCPRLHVSCIKFACRYQRRTYIARGNPLKV